MTAPTEPTPGENPVEKAEASAPTVETPATKTSAAVEPEPQNRWVVALREIASGSPLRIFISIALAFVVGGVIIAFSDETVQSRMGYFFANPMSTLTAMWEAVTRDYGALIKGSIVDVTQPFPAMFLPLTNTMHFAGPLIAAGLGIALSFRVGLFNIGGQGQMLWGATIGALVGFQLDLPPVVHLIVSMLVAILVAAAWGAIAGLLKALTGAHEVIVTIMLNYIAVNVVTWLMRLPLFQGDVISGTPRTQGPDITSQFPGLIPDLTRSLYPVHWGFIMVLVAVVVFWWLMERSSVGYRFRMVGLNPDAAITSGIDVRRVYVLAMLASAAFVGVAAGYQVFGSGSAITPSVDSNIGFDAITVALLGASRAGGVLMAGLLFGALKAGSSSLKFAGGESEILGVIQGLIILMIAAPPLVRALFRLPKKGTTHVIADWWSGLFRRKEVAK